VPTSVYRPRHPDRTLLYQVLSQELETWLARKREACPWDDPIPPHVERSIREYLRCGIPGNGFARIKCTSCRHEYVLT